MAPVPPVAVNNLSEVVKLNKLEQEMKDKAAYRESFIQVCLELTPAARLNRIRKYHDFGPDYYKGDSDREFLGKLKHYDREVLLEQRMKLVKEDIEKLVMIAELRKKLEKEEAAKK